MSRFALQPSRVLTPEGFAADRCVLVQDGVIEAVLPADDVPADVARQVVEGDLLPGFIDLQVNGGGGVLLNDRPTVEGVAAIGRAHRRFGTTGYLPTLISDDLAVVDRAMRAVATAIAQGVPGVLGIHLEGPFLNPARKGVHDPSKFRILDAEAIALLGSLKQGRTLVTLAPELAPPGAIAELVARGVIVFAGHTAGTFQQVQAGLVEGLSGFTHLYNAMTPLGSREPGVVGAAFDAPEAWCGLIADGVHVHPAALRVALAAKGPDRLALVTDAMPSVGAAEKSFMLGGRRITVEDGRCTAPDGTLAGSDLDMAGAIRNAVVMMGVSLETAVCMASAVPAAVLGLGDVTGSISPGLRADFVLMNGGESVVETWISGHPSA
jgi:N-acetylglucosamine-6-phosphate deacetylase